MSNKNPDHKPRGRSRKSKRSFRPLDLSDLDNALPIQTPAHPRQPPQDLLPRRQAGTTHPVSRPNPPTILQRPQQPQPQPPVKGNQPSKKQSAVTPHPGWGSMKTQMTQLVQQGWSDVEFNQSNLDKLLLLCHTEKELKSTGYVLKQLTQKELFSKMRCTKCYTRRKGQALKSDKFASQQPTMAKSNLPEPGGPVLKKARHSQEHNKESAKPALPQSPPAVCFWHPGKILHVKSPKIWSCCQQKLSVRGCKSNTFHLWGDENDPDTHSPWRFYQTESDYPDSLIPNRDPRSAVALDCEMGISFSNESELIRLTAVDFFTGATLIDWLVVPDVKIKSWETRYSGVTANQIQEAKQNGRCFFGRDAAREALIQFVGPETVLVMHGGSSDLTALRMIHPYVVDSFIVDAYKGGKVEGGRNLKNLMMLRTGRAIQNRGALGHDSLEDALATRELVARFMATIPDHEEGFFEAS